MKKGFIIAIIIIAIIILCSVGFIARKNNVSEEKNYTIEQIEDYSYFVLKYQTLKKMYSYVMKTVKQ